MIAAPLPWVIIGWLVLAILIVLILAAPIAAFVLIRQRNRHVADFERRRAESGIGARTGRPIAPPPTPPGTPKASRPSR